MEHADDDSLRPVPYTTKDMSPHKKGALDASSQDQHKNTSGNEALETLKRGRVNLEEAITLETTWFAHEMNRFGLLPDVTHREVINPNSMLSEAQKATKMVSALEILVGINAQKLEKFVELLQQKQEFYGDIANHLSPQRQADPAIQQSSSRFRPSNSEEISTENYGQLNAKFIEVTFKLAELIEDENISFKKFRLIAEKLLEKRECDDMWDYFTQVTLEPLLHYGKLEKFATTLLKNSPQVGALFDQYQEDIDHYYNLTKIIDFLQSNDKEHLLVQSDAEHTEELRIKITGVEITDKFMSYIEDVWKSLKRIPNLVMATSLLKNIQDSCIEVTWLISKEAAAAICESGPLSREIFMENHISLVWLNEECIYDEEVHVHSNIKEDITALDLATQKTKLDHQLIKSAKEGEAKRVEELLKNGASVDTLDPEKELWTPLMWASWNGHLETVKQLLLYKPKVNAAAQKGWAPLILASREGHAEIVETLLDHGADVNQETDSGWSSLLMAASHGRTRAGKILLERGATIDSGDQGGYTPLAQAAQEGMVEFINMMLEHKPDLDLNVKTKGYWTALMLACMCKHTEVVKLLIEKQADMNTQKPDGINALHIASYAGCDEIVHYMVHNKVDVNAADNHGVTALMFAIKQGHREVTKILTWNGKANLNLQDDEAKLSAPFFAIKCEHNDILDLLMRTEKIDTSIRDVEGNSLVDFAKKHNLKAYDLLAKKYKEKMGQLLPSVGHLPPPATGATPAAAAGSSKRTTKEARDYVTRVFRNIDLRMSKNTGKPVAAGAA